MEDLSDKASIMPDLHNDRTLYEGSDYYMPIFYTATNNEKIRTALNRSGMKYYELADLLGIADTTLSRKLRRELSEEEQDQIVKMIQERTGDRCDQ